MVPLTASVVCCCHPNHPCSAYQIPGTDTMYLRHVLEDEVFLGMIIMYGFMVYQVLAVTWNRCHHPHFAEGANHERVARVRAIMDRGLTKLGKKEEFEMYKMIPKGKRDPMRLGEGYGMPCLCNQHQQCQLHVRRHAMRCKLAYLQRQYMHATQLV
jgi:hypothetical protein